MKRRSLDAELRTGLARAAACDPPSSLCCPQGPGEEGSSLSLPDRGHVLGPEAACWDERLPTHQGSALPPPCG